MNDRVNIGVFCKDSINRLFIGDIDLLKKWSLSANELDTVDDLARGVVEIVGQHDLISRIQQCKCRKGANIASAPKIKCQSAV